MAFLIGKITRSDSIAASDWLANEYTPKLISVIIPTFNRRQLLDEALDSVRAQHYRPIEVIVVDDGSMDGTAELVQEWQLACQEEIDFSVQYVSQSNQGPSAARNRGLLKARGQYLQFLDSDDRLLPDKLSDALAAFATDPALDLVYCLRGELSATTRDVTPWTQQHADLEKDLSPAEVVLTAVCTPLPVFSRTVVSKAGPWDERLRSLEDWEYIGRVTYWARSARCVKKIQALCRAHDGPRLSINPWGDAAGVAANAHASMALYPLVVACDSPHRAAAVSALARRSLSCVRVAVGAGHCLLARKILAANDVLLATRKRIWLESWLWRVLLYLPDAMTIFLFRPVRAFKQRPRHHHALNHSDRSETQ